MSRLNLTPSQAAQDTISFPALTGLAGTIAEPCFSPHTNRGKRFLGPNLICAVDGGTRPNYGSAAYRQLCPAYPFANCFATCFTSHAKAALVIGQKAAQERFSEEKFPEPYSTSLLYITGNAFLNSSAASLRTTSAELTAHNKLRMNSRNQTTIATDAKHRQPIFLHPTVESGAIRRQPLQCRHLRRVSPASASVYGHFLL